MEGNEATHCLAKAAGSSPIFGASIDGGVSVCIRSIVLFLIYDESLKDLFILKKKTSSRIFIYTPTLNNNKLTIKPKLNSSLFFSFLFFAKA
jgi:hypothetical protein